QATAGTYRLRGGGGENTLTGVATTTAEEEFDTNFTLTNGRIEMESVGKDTLIGITNVKLTGGDGANVFDVTGWTGTATVDGRGGQNTAASTADADFTLNDTTLTHSIGGTVTLVSVDRALLTGGGGDTRFFLTGWNGSGVLDGGLGF